MKNKKSKQIGFLYVIFLLLVTFVLLYLTLPDGPGSGISDSYIPFIKNDSLDDRIKLKIIEAMKRNESDALCIMKGNQLLMEAGDEQMVINIASVRKSLISGLFGIAVKKGLINLDQSLEELKIDDSINPLTEIEKKATIRDLIKARSGIYIEAVGETSEMEKKRPKRGSHLPGTYWYYNNWDFNTLGVIFEKKTSMGIGQAFYEWIAKPTGMKRFKPGSVLYETSSHTSMRMYRFYMCASDLCRFGSLYTNEGVWNGKQIIPKEWVAESIVPYSEATYNENVTGIEGYGYLWWISPSTGTAWGSGSAGQHLIIDRKNRLTIAMLNTRGASKLSRLLYPYVGKFSDESEAIEIRNTVLGK
jgi:CubicO group peptidase (beta-lactamase class C family)